MIENNELGGYCMRTTSKNFNDFSQLIKRNWYVQGFNAVPAILAIGPLSGMHEMHKNLGYSYTGFMMGFENDLCELYYDKDDLKFVGEEFLKKYKADKSYLEKIMQRDKKLIQPLLKIINNNFLTNNKIFLNLSTQALVEQFRKLQIINYETYGISHVVEGIGLTCDIKLKDALLNELRQKSKEGKLKEDKFNEYLTILTQPIRKCFIHEENESLYIIMEEVKKNRELCALFSNASSDKIQSYISQTIFSKSKSSNSKQFKKISLLLKKHLKDFFWIKSSYQGGNDYTLIMLIDDLKTHFAETKQIDVKTKRYFENNLTAKKALIRKLGLSNEIKNLVYIIDTITYWQDDRKKLILKHCWNVTKIIKEIAARLGIKPENLKYLAPDEISYDFLSKLTDKELSQRRIGSVYFYCYGANNHEEMFGVFTGNDYAKFKQLMKGEDSKKDAWEIMGMCASTDNATGKVFICRTIDDIQNFPHGAVLVTSMTRPEFVPAMKKAAAIVTDEGGITSHAAVISRELGVPCVIGTKNATKLLNNGDLVMVNANHGMVKILK